MPTQPIQTELRDFIQFASQRVTSGAECTSLEELVQQWRSDSEYAATVADVEDGIKADAEGKAKSVDDAFSEVRSKLGIRS